VKGSLTDRLRAHDRAVAELVAAPPAPKEVFGLDPLGEKEIRENTRQPLAHRDNPVFAALAPDNDKLAFLEQAQGLGPPYRLR
jgi:hypothetical protein